MIEGAGTTPPTPSGGTSRPRPDGDVAHKQRSPNFAARRLLASTIGVTVLIAGGVVAWRVFGGDDERAASGLGAWDEIVIVDRSNGETTAFDRDGAVTATAVAGAGVDAVHVEADRVALVQSTHIALTSLDGTAATIVPLAADAVVERLPIDGGLWLAIGAPPALGGNVTLVDGISGTTYDVAALADLAEPRFFLGTLRHDPTGAAFAVADATNFQTIVIRTDVTPPAATFFPDVPVAVSTDRVVTSQVVGRQADVALSDQQRIVLATVSGELPAGGALVDGDVLLVSIDGAVTRFGPNSTEADGLGSVAVPTGSTIRSIHPAVDGTRWVIVGDVFQAVIDGDGATIYTHSFAAPITPLAVQPGWRCLAVGGGETWNALVDLSDGATIADLTGVVVTATSADGCTVLATRAGVSEVIGRDGIVQLGVVRGAALAPDGSAVVVLGTDATASLVEIDDGALGERVDITDHMPVSPTIAFRQQKP